MILHYTIKPSSDAAIRTADFLHIYFANRRSLGEKPFFPGT
jgi:hypothetical protein